MRSIRKTFICTASLFSVIILWVLYAVPYHEPVVEGWDYDTPRNASTYITESTMTAQILPKNFCNSTNLMVIMVCSAPSNLLERNAIRSSWGADLNAKISLFFLLGESQNLSVRYAVSLESHKFNDIIEEQFIDSYNNLTLKSVMMLKLISQHCLNSTKYLLKIDDDMYTNVKGIQSWLEERKTDLNLLTGKLICGAKPIKDVNSKWYAPSYLYSYEWYPNYLSGTGYLMSVDVANKLFKVAMKTPLLHLEDVFLTGICAHKLGIKATNNVHFTFNQLVHEPCLLRNLFTAHHFNYTYMKVMHQLLQNPNIEKRCPKSDININNWVARNIRKKDKHFHHVNCSIDFATRIRSTTIQY